MQSNEGLSELTMEQEEGKQLSLSQSPTSRAVAIGLRHEELVQGGVSVHLAVLVGILRRVRVAVHTAAADSSPRNVPRVRQLGVRHVAELREPADREPMARQCALRF